MCATGLRAGGRAAVYVERAADIEVVKVKVKYELFAWLRKGYRRRAMSSSVSFKHIKRDVEFQTTTPLPGMI